MSFLVLRSRSPTFHLILSCLASFKCVPNWFNQEAMILIWNDTDVLRPKFWGSFSLSCVSNSCNDSWVLKTGESPIKRGKLWLQCAETPDLRVVLDFQATDCYYSPCTDVLSRHIPQPGRTPSIHISAIVCSPEACHPLFCNVSSAASLCFHSAFFSSIISVVFLLFFWNQWNTSFNVDAKATLRTPLLCFLYPFHQKYVNWCRLET